MNLFKLFGTIAINNSGANKAIDETSGKAAGLASKLKSTFSSVGSLAVNFGKTVAVGLGTASAALGALTVKSLGLLGELEQNLGGSEQVFGRYATGVQKQAETAYKTMGLSQSQFLQTANKMGALFQGSGMGMRESAEMSMEVMQRASDVASIMGIDVGDAMEAVTGMAKGNFTMMDNLGVAMNDTTLEAYRMEKGYSKAVSEMTTGEKVMLAQEMFLEKTAYATGNYTRENDTLAGSLTTAKAALINFLSGAGSADQLAEAFVGAADQIINSLSVLLPKLTGGFQTIIKKLTPEIPRILKAALPGIITGATALIVGLAEALPDLVEILVEEMPFIMEQLGNALEKVFPALLQSIQTIFETIDFKGFGEWFGNAIVSLINSIPGLFSNLGNTISWAWANVVWPFIQGLFKATFDVEVPDWETTKELIATWWDTKVWPVIQEKFKAWFGIELPDWEGTKQKIADWWSKDVLPQIKKFFDVLLNIKLPDWETVKKTVSEWWTTAVSWLENKFSVLLDIKLPTLDDIKQKLSTLWDNVVSTWNSIKHALGINVESGVTPTMPGRPSGWGGQHANGLDRVPYNEYPALLHRNEAVLTAAEASVWRSGSYGGDFSRLEAGMHQLAALMQQVVNNTGAGNNIVLDSGALVGQLMPSIDAGLGVITARKRRG